MNLHFTVFSPGFSDSLSSYHAIEGDLQSQCAAGYPLIGGRNRVIMFWCKHILLGTCIQLGNLRHENEFEIFGMLFTDKLPREE